MRATAVLGICALWALVVFQWIYLLPACVYTIDQFGVPRPGYLKQTARVPDWAIVLVPVAGVLVGVAARRRWGRRWAFLAPPVAINLVLHLIMYMSFVTLTMWSLPTH